MKASDLLAALLAEHCGLALSPQKSTVIWVQSANPSDQVVGSCKSRQYALVVGAMETLGGVIGVSVEGVDYRANIVKEILRKSMAEFDILSNEKITAQVFLLLLRQSVSLKSNYVIRCVAPSLLRDSFVQYQDKLLKLIKTKLKLPDNLSLTSLAVVQMALPLRLGGLGIRCLSKDNFLTPFVASFMQVIQLKADSLESHPNLPTYVEFNEAVRSIRQVLRPYVVDEVKMRELDKVLPENPSDLIAKYRRGGVCKLQQRLTEIVEVSTFNRIINDTTGWSSKRDKARFLDLSSPHASTWLSTYPSSSSLTLSNDHFFICIRMHLGLLPMDYIPKACHKCGASLNAGNAWHPMVCPGGKKLGVIIDIN
jgi:hypothetical protein